MATTTTPPDPPSRPNFWLQFQLFSDGLDSRRARALTSPEHSTFHPFPRLPTELRLQIWSYLVAPRILLISCLEASTAAEQLADLASRPSPPLVPVLLHVSREARELGLARYELGFSWKVPHVLEPPSKARARPPPPQWSPPRVYFNYALDAVYLAGELEPYDAYGFNSPMAYFLRREEAARVRRVAVAFRALRYGEAGPQQIFGTLFHVVDRLAPADGRVLVAVTPGDEMTHALMGGEAPLVVEEDDDDDEEEEHEGEEKEGEGILKQANTDANDTTRRIRRRRSPEDRWKARMGSNEIRSVQGESNSSSRDGQEAEVNPVQKVWRDWYRGSIVTSSVANMQFVLVREADLERHVADQVSSVS
ncbi:hypothetical protein F4778DRAFT_782900 [Xylariomycetidae sp. FL2044]|nr:hypothetical protein F4778DRAFT_782900 [Xylariomycetidae sp. FL2044]